MIKNKLTKGGILSLSLSNLAFGYNDGWDTPSYQCRKVEFSYKITLIGLIINTVNKNG